MLPYNDLRPCPFCGEQHELKVINDIHFGKCQAIICHGRVLLEAYNARQLIVAAEAWNTRPIEDALRGELAQVRNAERKEGTMNDPDEKPIDLDAPIMITGREYETLKGELAQAREDRQLAERAMKVAYYGCLMIEAHGGQIPLIELKAAMQAIETALRITPYWPE